jgi:hypothetical protein
MRSEYAIACSPRLKDYARFFILYVSRDPAEAFRTVCLTSRAGNFLPGFAPSLS